MNQRLFRSVYCIYGGLLCAVLLWPAVIGQIFPLDWYAGDLRVILYSLQGACLTVSLLGYLTPTFVDRMLHTMFPSRRHFLYSVAFCCVALSFAVVTCELAFRVLGWPFTGSVVPSEYAIVRFDPDLGWSYIPNLSTTQKFGSERREVALHFDGIGARIPHADTVIDLSAPTVMFVGGSLTMGHGLPHAETLAGQLDARPDFPFQVVNLGVQAYGTDQSLLMLKRHFAKFQITAVVYVFICWHVERNEVADRRFLIPDARFPGTKPRFALTRDGQLYLKERARKYGDFSYSRVWAYVQVGLTRNGPRRTLKLTNALLIAMKNFVESRGAELIVVYWHRPGDINVCGGVPFVTTELNVVRTKDHEPSGWDTWHIAGDGHPDARANRHVAGLLLEEFKRLGFISDRLISLQDQSSRSEATEAIR